MLTRGQKRKLVDDSVHPALSKRKDVDSSYSKVIQRPVINNNLLFFVIFFLYNLDYKFNLRAGQILRLSFLKKFSNTLSVQAIVQMFITMRIETLTYNGSKSTHKFALIGGIQLLLRSFSGIFISSQTE